MTAPFVVIGCGKAKRALAPGETCRAIESIVKRVKTAEDARDGYVIELECARERARIATQAVIDAIGSVGPESVEQAVPRLVAVMREARERAVRAEAVLTRGGAAIVDEPAERSLYDARAALRDLVAALALDDGPRIDPASTRDARRMGDAMTGFLATILRALR